jgi:hypothetical protein
MKGKILLPVKRFQVWQCRPAIVKECRGIDLGEGGMTRVDQDARVWFGDDRQDDVAQDGEIQDDT